MPENSEPSYHTESLDAAATITGAGYQTALSPSVSAAVQPESSVVAEPDSLEQPAELPPEEPPVVPARGSASGIPIGRIYPVTMPRMRAEPEPSQWEGEQEASPLPESLREPRARSHRPGQPTETGAMLGPRRRVAPRGGKLLMIAAAAGMIVAGVVIGGSMFSSPPVPAARPVAEPSSSMAGWASEEATPTVTATPAPQVVPAAPPRKTHLAKKAKGGKSNKSAKKSKKAVAGKAARISPRAG